MQEASHSCGAFLFNAPLLRQLASFIRSPPSQTVLSGSASFPSSAATRILSRFSGVQMRAVTAKRKTEM
jgi:hypothetical protein